MAKASIKQLEKTTSVNDVIQCHYYVPWTKTKTQIVPKIGAMYFSLKKCQEANFLFFLRSFKTSQRNAQNQVWGKKNK